MHVYLVRHTEYWNPESVYAFHLPFHLTERGREHAARIGNWFAEQQLRLPIFSSPIVRTVQTSEIIASKTGSSVAVDSRLIESYCPALQGTKIPANEPWKVEEDEPTREPHASELARMQAVYEEAAMRAIDCILVSHGDPLTLLYYFLTKKDPPRYFWDPKNAEQVIRRGEIVKIETDGSSVLAVNRFQV